MVQQHFALMVEADISLFYLFEENIYSSLYTSKPKKKGLETLSLVLVMQFIEARGWFARVELHSVDKTA